MSADLQNILLEIVSRIQKKNEGPKDSAILTSEDMYRKICSDIVESEEKTRTYLDLLAKANYVFVIKIVNEDKDNDIKGIQGYVVTDAVVLQRIKEYAFSELENLYSSQFYERKHATTITREMISEARKFNNTPFGNMLNVAVMLQQFDRILEKNAVNYTVTSKKIKLIEVLEEFVGHKIVDEVEKDLEKDLETNGIRAVDMDEYNRLQNMNLSGKWGGVVSKYGVQFVVRVHLRKFEFDTVRGLIKSKKIAQLEDLIFLRDSLRKMSLNVQTNPTIGPHVEKIADLQRLVQSKLNILRQTKKAIDEIENI